MGAKVVGELVGETVVVALVEEFGDEVELVPAWCGKINRNTTIRTTATTTSDAITKYP